jgi:hypothetical protein
MNIPCIILKGCLRGKRVIKFIKHNMPDMYDDSQRLVELSMKKGKSVRAYRWSWGIEIGCHEYRSKSTSWWDELLSMFGSTTENPEIVILYNIDSLSGENQRVVRRHVEEDYKKVRYIMTCTKNAILDPSLESRCAILISREDDIPPLPKIRTYKDAEELWLSDVLASEILDAMFVQAIESDKEKLQTKKRYKSNEEEIGKEKELIRLWCWYSDMLKSCYQELTVIECAFKDIRQLGVSK